MSGLSTRRKISPPFRSTPSGRGATLKNKYRQNRTPGCRETSPGPIVAALSAIRSRRNSGRCVNARRANPARRPRRPGTDRATTRRRPRARMQKRNADALWMALSGGCSRKYAATSSTSCHARRIAAASSARSLRRRARSMAAVMRCTEQRQGGPRRHAEFFGRPGRSPECRACPRGSD